MSTNSFTNDSKRRSFVDVAADSHFPIQNLPYGSFIRKGDSRRCCGAAIGEWILDLTTLEQLSKLECRANKPAVFDAGRFNEFAAEGKSSWAALREEISRLLDANEPTLRDNDDLKSKVLVRQTDVAMQLPMSIGDYTDFYSSKEHATNVGTMFRGADNALMPNWLHLPVAYHGRASSIVPSGTPIRRPSGQTMPPDADSPSLTATRSLDFELEMGFFIGPGNELGEPISCSQAEDHIFGLVLVNDWSARDIQRWEYVPLGPFLAKNFATSISPWIVTISALEPFRCESPPQDPAPLEYLAAQGPSTFDLNLEVSLKTEQLDSPFRVCQSNFRYLYWSMRQQLAHHSITGCNLQPGDLLASGTISGPTPDSFGSMLELAWRGERPIELPSGETRSMIQDGDNVIMSGWGQGDGYRVGFGNVEGVIRPAR